jgi:glyoxylase-like metal-dependent hydrolase (beta-lactamase superfamily II)
MPSAADWLEVADRVFVRRYGFFDQSIGAVIGGQGVLVVDTRSTHAQADELLADLRALTPLPVSAVVNTHHHYDHAFGNARFASVPIWGHDRCAELLRSQADAERMRRHAMDELPDLAHELAAVAVTPPTETFDETATLDLGDRLVELRYLGHGHTDNDIVALVPDAGVLFAGDLLENDAPPSFGDAYPVAWAETVGERLLPLVREVVVPGHGTPGGVDFAQRGAGELGLLARLIASTMSGMIGLDEVLATSPYPQDVTRTALARGHHELENPPHHPRGG